MISKINYIKKFGCFDHFKWDDLKPFNSTNIIYGYNGSGKTTLSNLLYLLSTECKNKNDLAKEYLISDSEFQIETQNGNFSEKNYETYNNPPIYVFNTKFVSDHIFDGSKSKMSSFASHSTGITNEIIDEIDERISILTNRKNALTSKIIKLDDKLENIWNSQKREFNSNIKGKRLTDSPTIIDSNSINAITEKENLKKLYQEIEKIDNLDNLTETLSSVKEKANNIAVCDIENDELEKILNTSVNIESTEVIKTHIKEIADSYKEGIININKWFIDGSFLLKQNKKGKQLTCPLCKSNIESIINDLITEYDSHFNEKIKELFKLLEYYEEKLKLIPSQIKGQKAILNDINVLLKQFNNTLSIEMPDKIGGLNTLSKLIQNKKRNPNSKVEVDHFLFIEIQEFNNSIIAIKKELNDRIEQLEKEIGDLRKRDLISEIKKKAKDVAIAEYNDKSNLIISTSKKSNNEIAKKIKKLIQEIEKRLKILYINRDSEVSKLDAETKFVNIYLGYLGVSKFVIQKEKDKDSDNIIITYKAGVKKHSLTCSLSEGEKTALAFAYFLSKIRVEKIEKTCTLDDAIIVIDDPISSLDENRLYHTANLIDSFFHYNDLANEKKPKQTFIFSHNIIFLKYITNIFHANSSISINEYYIDPFKHIICKVPNSLKNFTSTYLEKIDEIIKYDENTSDITYEQAKKFIPNYIRIVLESFLSFKFALVKESSKDRLPGLNFLISKAIAELNSYDENLDVGGVKRDGVKKRLANLKRIADNESHGSISKIESLNYISERELKDYCKHTLQVIKYFDQIHFVKAKSLI